MRFPFSHALAEARAELAALAAEQERFRIARDLHDLLGHSDVDPAHEELFGWVVREGLTNIVRHSRARSCAVRIADEPGWL